MKDVCLPYGDKELVATLPSNKVIFEGNLKYTPGLANLKTTLLHKLDNPTAGESLANIIKGKSKILILIDDNTRSTPVNQILPVLINYLVDQGFLLNNIEVLVATGTHRKMSETEVVEKIGTEIVNKIKIFQHDITKKEDLIKLDPIYIGQNKIPVEINKKVLNSDVIIGIGNITPHDQAGYTGGGKIVQPGICGYSTTSATHIAAAFLKEVPLGIVENPCRHGIEAVAKKVGLDFIINVVKNFKGEVKEVVTGDFIAAHREGALLAKNMYSIKMPGAEEIDVLISSAFPYDIDWWQSLKGIVSSFLAAKNSQAIIIAAACPDGLASNHPKLKEWLKLTYRDLCSCIKKTSIEDEEADLVAASIAIYNSRIREKMDILFISDGISKDDARILGYKKFVSLQNAIDYALERYPSAKFGIIPRGGDFLPV